MSALVFFVLTFPLLIALAIVIAGVHRGSPLFVQKRIGQKGASFKIVKFKTIKADGNLTPFLKFLRRSKLDELPQLFNVLAGEMSWVGPRPDISGYYDELTGENRKILNLKPGLTGIASLKFIDEERVLAQKDNPEEYTDKVIFPEKVRLNRYYQRHVSCALDFKILLKTLILLLKF